MKTSIVKRSIVIAGQTCALAIAAATAWWWHARDFGWLATIAAAIGGYIFWKIAIAAAIGVYQSTLIRAEMDGIVKERSKLTNVSRAEAGQ
jgi:hypothetical protein